MPDVATREQIIAVAESQIGVTESPWGSNRTPYTAWYGMVGPWCAMFVSWVFAHAGAQLSITTDKGFAYCPYGVSYFKSIGKWAGPSVRPQRGWIVFFDFIGRPSHVGIVEGVLADGRIATIEGNTNPAGGRTGGEVMRHYRRVSGGIIGYGIIDYDGSGVPSTPIPEQPSQARGHLEWPELHKGTRTSYPVHTRIVQQVVDAVVDGDFGSKTANAVAVYQRGHGLRADGVVGPKTATVIIQNVLRDNIDGSLDLDGDYGAHTTRVVKDFQQRMGLTADGVFGNLSTQKLWEMMGSP